MPTVHANGIDMYYEVQGSGEPLVLIPYTSADQACYAFQVADYANHFSCYSVDLRGAGLTDKPDGEYTTELYADDISAFMQAVGIERAHVSGVSLGGAIGMWLAGKHPEQVKSLSLHSAWHATDEYLRASVNSWRIMAEGLGNIPDVVISGIFLCCFTPEMYESRPDYLQSLADFVRSRPVQPVDAFMRQTDAVLAHDATSVLGAITAPTLITFGRHDFVCSTRFAAPLQGNIANTELVIFEDCAHAAIYENVEEFNSRTLQFLQHHSG